MKRGITPRRFWLPLWGWVRYTDHRDRDYHRSRGLGGTIPTIVMDISYNHDAGYDMPDQNADGLPEGCTGYAQTQEAQNADHMVYDPEFTYNKTLQMQGLPPNSPCDIRTSMKSTIVYGVKPKGEMESEAINHRQGPYENVRLTNGLDWFDSIRLALRDRSLSVATPWFHEFFNVAQDGILSSVITGDVDTLPWHNHLFTGEIVIDNVPYILDKSWQGRTIGNKGWLLWSRELVNKVMEIEGTEVFIRSSSGDVKYVVLTIMETILSYMGMLLSLKRG